MAKKKPERDEEREERIDNEIIVDCYDEYEQMSGWFAYLEDKLHFPFTAKCISKRDTSPLKKGETVEVVGMHMTEDDDLDENGDFEVHVFIQWEKRKFAVPLAQLEPIASTDEETKQAVGDWHYWKGI